jgi:DNA-binding transcriptional ArsR family regulator
MAEESFMLVSLKEEKAKKLARIISNETCRKILDYLAARKEATETQISQDLKLPPSTVNYNLQHLYENKLVEVDEFHYSPKGKEVNHYKLANKLIIIAPKEAPKRLMEQLKNLLPVGVITLAASGALYFGQKLLVGAKTVSKGAVFVAQDAAEAAPEAMRAVPRAFEEAAEAGAQAAAGAPGIGGVQALNETINQTVNRTIETLTETVTKTVTVTAPANAALWFLAGAAFVLVLTLVFELVRRKT